MNQSTPIIALINCFQDQLCADLFQNITSNLIKEKENLKISNKYYSAYVKLLNVNGDSIIDLTDLTSVEAVLFVFSPAEKISFDQVKHCLQIIDKINPSVKLLICSRCNETDVVSKDSLFDWSMENDFELIEMDNVEENDDEDNEFPDICGLQRIMEVLDCNTWSNSVLKESKLKSITDIDSTNSDEFKLKEGLCSSDINSQSFAPIGLNNVNSTSPVNQNDNNDDETNSYIKDLHLESFEDLFQNIGQLKEQAKDLSFDDRKIFAEDVVTKFWNLLAVDNDELSDNESL